LATTALEEFWDTSKPLLFLGEWCCRYSRKKFWVPLNGSVIESPWDSMETIHDAYEYVNDVFERLIPVLTQAMNDIHGECFSERYWRIQLGPWLLYYLSSVYDRYVILSIALAQYPDLVTCGLDESCYYTPRDTYEFVCLIQEDSYNLQLYSRILSLLDWNFPRRNMEVRLLDSRRNPSRFEKCKKTMLRSFTDLIGRIAGAKHSIVLENSYFARSFDLKLFIRSSGGVVPILSEFPVLPFFPSDLQSRNKLMEALPKAEGFEGILRSILPYDMPQGFLEGFGYIDEIARRTFPVVPKAIFSANSWYFKDVFKRWAAGCADMGTQLLGTQHGAIYGILERMPFEAYERSIVDVYYTWGWEELAGYARTVAMPATKLTGRKTLGADNRREGILYVTTSRPRYLIQFPFPPAHFVTYLEWQSRFIQGVSSQLFPLTRVRPHFADNGWDITHRLKDSFPELTFEGWDVPFLISLERCRLYVCDHHETTFAEALSANVPTIIFWDQRLNPVRKEAQSCYDTLHKAGILFYDPQKAAEVLNAVYVDVEGWWNEPMRQAAREAFCCRFARTSLNAITEWSKEFSQVARTGL